MKTNVDFTINLEKFEDLDDVFSCFRWDYLDNIQFGLTQVGSYGDIRFAMELMKYVNKQFEKVLFLRSESPDLMSQYNEIFEVMAEKKKEMDENYKRLVLQETI